jgi:carnosine N-methyltransferase
MAFQTYLRHDQPEQNHWDEVCRAFRQYATFAMAQWTNQTERLSQLPAVQRVVLPPALRQNTPEFEKRAEQYKEASIRNQFCLDCILRHAGMPHSQQIPKTAATFIVSDTQMSRVSSVLKSLARDWSADGKAERDMSYQPILEEMQAYMPIRSHAKDGEDKKGSRANAPKVCVPGAGEYNDLKVFK